MTAHALGVRVYRVCAIPRGFERGYTEYAGHTADLAGAAISLAGREAERAFGVVATDLGANRDYRQACRELDEVVGPMLETARAAAIEEARVLARELVAANRRRIYVVAYCLMMAGELSGDALRVALTWPTDRRCARSAVSRTLTSSAWWPVPASTSAISASSYAWRSSQRTEPRAGPKTGP